MVDLIHLVYLTFKICCYLSDLFGLVVPLTLVVMEVDLVSKVTYMVVKFPIRTITIV